MRRLRGAYQLTEWQELRCRQATWLTQWCQTVWYIAQIFFWHWLWLVIARFTCEEREKLCIGSLIDCFLLWVAILFALTTHVSILYRTYYYNVSTVTMQVTKSYQWFPSETEINFCKAESVRYDKDCDSYVVSAFKQSDSLYYICASSAKTPTCKKFQMNSEVGLQTIMFCLFSRH